MAVDSISPRMRSFAPLITECFYAISVRWFEQESSIYMGYLRILEISISLLSAPFKSGLIICWGRLGSLRWSPIMFSVESWGGGETLDGFELDNSDYEVCVFFSLSRVLSRLPRKLSTPLHPFSSFAGSPRSVAP